MLLREGAFHGEHLDEGFLASLVVVLLDNVADAVPEDIGDVHADALTHQGVAALLIDHGALLVHHVVVFQQALTDTEVVFLHLLLGALDALGNHRTLNTLTFVEAQTVHHLRNTLRGE